MEPTELNNATITYPDINGGNINSSTLTLPIINGASIMGNTLIQDTVDVNHSTILIIDGETFTGQELRIILSRLKGIVKDLFPNDLPQD